MNKKAMSAAASTDLGNTAPKLDRTNPKKMGPKDDTGPKLESTSPKMTGPKVMIYVTTHMSGQHIWQLKSCWPTALQNSLLLNSSDVVVYLTPNTVASKNVTNSDVRLLQHTFRNQKLTIHTRPNLGYQESATAALTDAMAEGWWEGYDWIVRVNPDVIIRDDSQLWNIVNHDKNATGILVNCVNSVASPAVHTDFFAIRPRALLLDNLISQGSAERDFTNAIKKSIIGKGNHRWLDAARPTNNICRAGHGRDVQTTPVLHHHYKTDTFTCPIPF